jgi:formylmethanofuran dehydrogenase subunit C
MISLTLRSRPPGRLSLTGVTPARLAALSEAEIAKLPVRLGNRDVALGEWFEVRVTGSGEARMTIAADGDRLD